MRAASMSQKTVGAHLTLCTEKKKKKNFKYISLRHLKNANYAEIIFISIYLVVLQFKSFASIFNWKKRI